MEIYIVRQRRPNQENRQTRPREFSMNTATCSDSGEVQKTV